MLSERSFLCASKYMLTIQKKSTTANRDAQCAHPVFFSFFLEAKFKVHSLSYPPTCGGLISILHFKLPISIQSLLRTNPLFAYLLIYCRSFQFEFCFLFGFSFRPTSQCHTLCAFLRATRWRMFWNVDPYDNKLLKHSYKDVPKFARTFFSC